MMPHLLLLLTVLQTPDVEAILTSDEVAKAMQIVDTSKDWALEELVTLTEIPAPPFGEEARGAAILERFRRLALARVTARRSFYRLTWIPSFPPTRPSRSRNKASGSPHLGSATTRSAWSRS
jgi:hypothetical protein